MCMHGADLSIQMHPAGWLVQVGLESKIDLTRERAGEQAARQGVALVCLRAKAKCVSAGVRALPRCEL